MSEEEYAPSWKPSPGDEVSGSLVAVGTNDAGWGLYPIVTLEDEAGTQVAVHAFHQVLKSELAKRRPKMGDFLQIKYVGKPEGKNYESYKVKGGQEPEFNWATFGADEPSSEPPIDSSPLPREKTLVEKAEEHFGIEPPF